MTELLVRLLYAFFLTVGIFAFYWLIYNAIIEWNDRRKGRFHGD